MATGNHEDDNHNHHDADEHGHGHGHDHGEGLQRATLLLTAASGLLLAVGFPCAHLLHREDVETVLFVLAILAAGAPLAPEAARAALRLRPDMNLLMVIAVIGAAAIGEWHEGATVMFLFSVAEALEQFSLDRARAAIRKLLEVALSVPAEEVRAGEVVIVKPGEKIPLDGEVLAGSSAVNEAPLTGESMPKEKTVGDTVFAGSLNGHGAVEARVTRHVEDTALARLIRMVEQAQERRAPSQRFVDRFARRYTPVVLAGAIVVAIGPPLLFGQPFSEWFYRALVLLVIACPCALVISTPVAIVSGLASAARRGVLIKGGVYLEQAGSLGAIAFDKTGTLTRGVPAMTDVVPLNDHSPGDVLRIAAALESRSEHPLAQAVLRKAEGEGVASPLVEDFQAIAGKGAQGRVDGRTFTLGSARLFEELQLHTEAVAEVVEGLQAEGKTTLLLGAEDKGQGEGHVCGVLAVADQVRPEAAGVIPHLRPHCARHTVMLTGDNEGTARAVARQLDLDDYRAQLLPEDKVAVIRELRERHDRVAMVGDGINDAPALATATVGIAMGTAGSDAALETADIALMADDLTKLPFAIHLSRRTLAIVRFNVAFALAVKAVFLVLAVAGMATLWMAVAADTGASVLVVANSLRLLRHRDSEF